MRISLAVLVLVTLVPPVLSAAPERATALDELGANLRQARSLPVGTKTSFGCPEGLEQFTGVSMASVLAALSKPDFEVGNQYSYLLSSPIPPGQRGGGILRSRSFQTGQGASSVLRASTQR